MREMALYVHIPFCKNKCRYCDFISYKVDETCMDKYVDALVKEILSYKNYTFKTVFIGGGTPTILSIKNIKKLEECFRQLKLKENLEFTVESNPGTFSKEKLEAFKRVGVNRISIGLQSFDNKILETLGRIHTSEEFERGYHLAREIGYQNINIDLMFGLPNQTLEDWKQTLQKAVNLNPEHLSCYSLIIEEGTPFGDAYERDDLNLPEEDTEREMYRYGVEYLKENGYKYYEISNFAKENKECEHNLIYWDLEEYVGCGVAAHAYIDGERLSNATEIDEYIELVKKSGTGVVEKATNTKEDDIEEFMFMGLRKIDGIEKEKFKQRFGRDISDIYDDEIKKHKEAGLLKEDDKRIALTDKGIEISNTVMSDFLIDKKV